MKGNGSLPYFTAAPSDGTLFECPSNGTFVASNVRIQESTPSSGDLDSPSFATNPHDLRIPL